MLHSEPISGYDLAARLAQLESENALIVSLEVGATNSDWILSYHPREMELGLSVAAPHSTATLPNNAPSVPPQSARDKKAHRSQGKIGPLTQSELL